jgi:hypothetical protein
VTLPIKNIYHTSQFAQTLGGDVASIDSFKQSVSEFITNPNDSYEFGKDVGPSPGKFLWHVHMVPVSCPNALKQWDQDYERYTRCTSDRYLLYAKNTPNLSILLIDHILDPGAHSLWTPEYRLQLSKMEAIAEDFHFFKKYP